MSCLIEFMAHSVRRLGNFSIRLQLAGKHRRGAIVTWFGVRLLMLTARLDSRYRSRMKQRMRHN